MRMSVLTKKGMAIVMTAAMLTASVSTGFADEVDVAEISDEAVLEQETISVENTVAGFDDSESTDDDIVLSEEEFSIEEDSAQEEDIFPEEDSSDNALTAGIIEEEVLTAQEDYHNLRFEYSYGYEDDSYLYTDRELTLTVIDSDTGEEPEGRIEWGIDYYKDGSESVQPDFITESYNDENTALTLEADPANFKDGYSLSIHAMLYDENDQNCGSCYGNCSVAKERWALDYYKDGDVINWTAGDTHTIDYMELCHYYSEDFEGEFVDFDIQDVKVSDPRIVKKGEDGDGLYLKGINGGTTNVTFTVLPSGSDEVITITWSIIVSLESYDLYLTSPMNNKAVIPGTTVNVTKEISGEYYSEGDTYTITDFKNIEYVWNVKIEGTETSLPFSKTADGISIDTTGAEGSCQVYCKAMKAGKQVAADSLYFHIENDVTSIVYEAKLLDPDDEPGETIDLKNGLPVGRTAVVYPTVKRFTADNPDGVEVEGIQYSFYANYDINAFVSFFEYNEENGTGDEITVTGGEETPYTGDSFAVTRNDARNVDWMIRANQYDPESGSEICICESRLYLNDIEEEERDFCLRSSYGEEDDEKCLYIGYPLTFTVSDYDNPDMDLSDYTVDWSVECYRNGDDADGLVTVDENGNSITLTAIDDLPDEYCEFDVSAEIYDGSSYVGYASAWGQICKGGVFPRFNIAEQSCVVGWTDRVSKETYAWFSTPERSGDGTVLVKSIRLVSDEPDDNILSISEESDYWYITYNQIGSADMVITYEDPLTGKDVEYPFQCNIVDSDDDYYIEITTSKNNLSMVDKETVTLTYKVEAHHRAPGVYSVIPATDYRVEWNVDSLEYVTKSEEGGKLKLTAKYPENYDEDEDGSPSIRVTASVYPVGSDGPAASDSTTFYLHKEYYDVICNVKSPNGFTSLDNLPVGETATVTPVVKYFDSAHPGGVVVNGVAFGNFSYETDVIEVKAANGTVIESDPEEAQRITTPYFTIRRKTADHSILNFDVYKKVTEDYETYWETITSYDEYLDSIHDCSKEGHTLLVTKAKAATTAAAGNIQYWYCTTCHKYFKDAAGRQQITKAQTVIAKIVPKPSEVVTISKAPSGVKAKAAKKGKATLTWKKFKQTKKTKATWKKIKKIEVQYSTDKHFKTGVISKTLSKKKTKLTVKKLKAKTTYYFRVRYVEGPYKVSKWSSVKKVKAKK